MTANSLMRLLEKAIEEGSISDVLGLASDICAKKSLESENDSQYWDRVSRYLEATDNNIRAIQN